MESQPQNPEFRNNPENLTHVVGLIAKRISKGSNKPVHGHSLARAFNACLPIVDAKKQQHLFVAFPWVVTSTGA